MEVGQFDLTPWPGPGPPHLVEMATLPSCRHTEAKFPTFPAFIYVPLSLTIYTALKNSIFGSRQGITDDADPTRCQLLAVPWVLIHPKHPFVHGSEESPRVESADLRNYPKAP